MTTIKTEGKTVKRIFIGLLILNCLIEIIASLSMLINFPMAAEKGFGITYSDDLAVLGIGLGSNLALTSFVFLTGTIWTMRTKIEGAILGIAGAGMLVLFASLTYIQLGDPGGLLVDGIRGVLTILFGYLAYSQLKKQTS